MVVVKCAYRNLVEIKVNIFDGTIQILKYKRKAVVAQNMPEGKIIQVVKLVRRKRTVICVRVIKKV